MPLGKGSQHFPTDQRSWEQWSRTVPVAPDPESVTTVTVADKAVTNTKLRDSQPASVIGRVAATSGPPADIVSTADSFLVNGGGILGFGTIADTDIPATLARDTEVTSAIATALTPYITQTNADARYVALANVLNGSKSFDPPSLPTGAQTATTVTVTGAVVGDFAQASFGGSLGGIILTASVDSADTVVVIFLNMTGSTIDLGSATLRVRVWKQ